MSATLDDPDEVRYETVGRPCCPEDEIKVVDDAGNEVPRGVEGELTARGPHCFRGYYKAPEENAKSFDKDGFFYTGDLAVLREDGNIVITGRKKDQIIRGGENIGAVEIEELIMAHPDVVDVAIVAMPDPRMGEKVCAYIKPQPGTKPTLDDIAPFLEEKGIAAYKLPERVELVEEFPLTSVGKISKKDLREDIARKLKDEGKK